MIGRKMKKTIVALALIPLLAACTTPKTMMINKKTGQVEACGGNSTASMAGGAIGYHVQKSNDEKCVADLKSQGFKVIEGQGAQ